MTPNLFLATQTLFSPHKWFKQPRSERSVRKREHWDDPAPGIYEYIPGRGWYLVATDKTTSNPSSNASTEGTVTSEDSNASEQEKEPETLKLTNPVLVKYSKVLKKYMLQPDYDMRSRRGRFQNDEGRMREAGFFQLDDGVAWVMCWDGQGSFVPGPYKLWCIDAQSGYFRHMRKRDDPDYIASRRNSLEHDRQSQDSRSTQYKSGPGSHRDGPSISSTRNNSAVNSRANSRPASLRGLAVSNPSSKPGSRPGSPRRSPGVPLSEATTLLEPIASEQARSATASPEPAKVNQ